MPSTLPGAIPPKSIELFWAKVNKTETCWLWLGAKNRGGYGVATAGGTQFKAHRLAYIITYGELPDGVIVCHRCDNPACVRPEHLYAGTQHENMRDRFEKTLDSNDAWMTPRQTEIYQFIVGYINEKHYPPTIREIGAAFGIASPNGVVGHLRAFEKKGIISRAHGARSITLLKAAAAS